MALSSYSSKGNQAREERQMLVREKPEFEKVQRSFERRFGKSKIPLSFHEFTHPNGAKCVKVINMENGFWADYNVSWSRISLMRSSNEPN
jgi:hypothetical protein